MSKGSVVALILAFAGMQVAAGESLDDDRKQAIDAFVGQFTELAMFDGSIVVDIGGDLVYDESFGYANLELHVRHNHSTRFHLASVSKALTDVAIARMIDEGVFSLDTPLSKFLPDFPGADEIHIRHLVNHTSGIPHINRQPWGDGSLSMNIEEIIARLEELPLDFPPGTSEAYSNGGYAVLARILEIAGNGTFAEVMHATVLDPLAMYDTHHVSDVRTPILNSATGYEPGLRPGERRHPRYYAIESRPGGGSMVSSIGDMLRFMRAVFRDDFISPAMRREVMGENDEGFLSQGRSPGFVAKVLYRTVDDVIVVSLSNSYAVPSDWAMSIANLATGNDTGFDWPAFTVSKLAIAKDDPRLGTYLSSYTDEPVIVSRSAGGDLLMSGPGNSRNALIPLESGDFLQPLYFQMCRQNADSRVFVCKMLSGEDAYTSTYSPIAAQE